jgi:hypothetical protein
MSQELQGRALLSIYWISFFDFYLIKVISIIRFFRMFIHKNIDWELLPLWSVGISEQEFIAKYSPSSREPICKESRKRKLFFLPEF